MSEKSLGSWTECINPTNKIDHSFFRRVGFLNDNQKICSMCWAAELRKDNYYSGRAIIHKKSNDCKPEKDSL